MTHEWFCDWLSISQQHGGSWPDYIGGRVLKVSGLSVVMVAEGVAAISGEDIEVDYCTSTFNDVRGSYDTNMRVRMVGGRVEVWGNPSHWARLDNVFGLGLDDCVGVVNKVLSTLGLPVFTPSSPVLRDRVKYIQNGQPVRGQVSYSQNRQGNLTHHSDGAVLGRVDMTSNLSAGLGRTRELCRWAAGQKLYRSAPSNPGEYNYESVYLAISGDWLGCKLYDKSLAIERKTGDDLIKRVGKLVKSGALSEEDGRVMLTAGAEYLERLTLWAAEVGMTRYELRFGRKFLDDRGLRGWVPGVVQSELEVCAVGELDKLMSRAVVVNVDIEDSLTAAELQAFTRWKRGLDVQATLPKTSYYRVRAAILKKSGHDISRPATVSVDQPRPVFFRVKPLSLSAAPSWYRGPSAPALLAA